MIPESGDPAAATAASIYPRRVVAVLLEAALGGLALDGGVTSRERPSPRRGTAGQRLKQAAQECNPASMSSASSGCSTTHAHSS